MLLQNQFYSIGPCSTKHSDLDLKDWMTFGGHQDDFLPSELYRRPWSSNPCNSWRKFDPYLFLYDTLGPIPMNPPPCGQHLVAIWHTWLSTYHVSKLPSHSSQLKVSLKDFELIRDSGKRRCFLTRFHVFISRVTKTRETFCVGPYEIRQNSLAKR